jgi:hypothetical protein
MKTQEKNRITKAEHEKINQAKHGNYLNELMIKIEEKNTITKAEHEKINQAKHGK